MTTAAMQIRGPLQAPRPNVFTVLPQSGAVIKKSRSARVHAHEENLQCKVLGPVDHMLVYPRKINKETARICCTALPSQLWGHQLVGHSAQRLSTSYHMQSWKEGRHLWVSV